MQRTLLLPQLVLLISLPAGAAQQEPRVFAVLAELDRMAARPLWPGFEPREVPLEIFDGGRTWLLRHPRPPAEFVPVSGRADARVFEGRHESLRANTSMEVAGVATAAASFEGKAEETRPLAALLLHEAFHVFQARRHPRWGGNEADLFACPVENSESLALRRLESAALARALAAGNRKRTAGWAARALALRQERFARASAGRRVRAGDRDEGGARALHRSGGGGRFRASAARRGIRPGPRPRARVRLRLRHRPAARPARPRLFPQGFDPLNFERLSASDVLHTRWIKLGNAAGALEALDRRCLTESAGTHPLFEGVRRAALSGFPDEPQVDESGGSVRISAPGLTLSFRSARVSLSGNTVTISVSGSAEEAAFVAKAVRPAAEPRRSRVATPPPVVSRGLAN